MLINREKRDIFSPESMQNLTSFLSLEYEPAGKWFESYNYQRHQSEEGFQHIESEESSSSEDEEEIEETPDYLNYLKQLDPKDWKDQDHYKVIGLEAFRYKATAHQIKKAYKYKVLKHHPDKHKGSGEKERGYFTCITKAFEILSDPVKRRSYDSVDPEFDEFIPPLSENSKKNFYKVFSKAFDNNSRWSLKKNVPKLGDENSTFEQVNEFYGFWYDFDSWREFSYLDEESKDTAQDRDERRWIDKTNKAARAKRKKEEMTRLRTLVDNAYQCDPRIIKFKQDEKRKKEEEKMKKREAIRLKEEEEQRKIEEARLAQERILEAEKLKIEAEKKERDQQKKILKKEKKTLRTIIKDFDYFTKNEDERLTQMDQIERLVDMLSLSEIQEMNEAIQKSNESERKQVAQQVTLDKMKLLKDTEKSDEQGAAAAAAAVTPKPAVEVPSKPAQAEWTDEEIKLLVKGLKIIAVGVRDRWQVIANFINEHSRGKYQRTDKEVLHKTKEMQKSDVKIKEDANKNAFEKTLQTIKTEPKVAEAPTQRYATPAEQLLAEQGSNPAPWSVDEQKILEQALKSYPATLENRWEKIAECLPARSKKDCILRYKELVELIQAKKRAQEAQKKKP